jgi:hypothetical protein
MQAEISGHLPGTNCPVCPTRGVRREHKLSPNNNLGSKPVTTKTARNILAAALLASMLACGGGDPPTVCTSVMHPVTCAARPDSVTQAQTPAPALSVAPSALTIGNCTTRIPFIFSGGVGPYTIFTSDNFNVPVSTALVLDDVRFYFFADIRYPVGRDPDPATLTVLDSQSRTAIATIRTPRTFDSCPMNPLLKVFPETANFRTSEILAFQVSGGPPRTETPEVTFADAGVAELVAASAATFTVRAVAAVRATTLMTVATADGQRSSIVINVLPQP